MKKILTLLLLIICLSSCSQEKQKVWQSDSVAIVSDNKLVSVNDVFSVITIKDSIISFHNIGNDSTLIVTFTGQSSSITLPNGNGFLTAYGKDEFGNVTVTFLRHKNGKLISVAINYGVGSIVFRIKEEEKNNNL